MTHLHPISQRCRGLAIAGALAFIALAVRAAVDVSPTALALSGARASATNVTLDSAIGGIGNTAATAGNVRIDSGFPAELFSPIALELSGPTTVNEGDTFLLTAQLRCDDDTLLRPLPTVFSWSVVSGPLAAIYSTGNATAEPVFADSSARARAGFSALNATLEVLVRNSDDDNYSLYAADGLRDTWQVQWYGVNNPAAAPLVAPLQDGTPNLLKAAWNVPAMDRSTRATTALVANHLTLTFRRLRVGVAPRPTYVVEVSNDLFAWRNNAQTGGPYTTEISATSLDAETELVVVRDILAADSVARRFIRLRVTSP